MSSVGVDRRGRRYRVQAEEQPHPHHQIGNNLKVLLGPGHLELNLLERHDDDGQHQVDHDDRHGDVEDEEEYGCDDVRVPDVAEVKLAEHDGKGGASGAQERVPLGQALKEEHVEHADERDKEDEEDESEADEVVPTPFEHECQPLDRLVVAQQFEEQDHGQERQPGNHLAVDVLDGHDLQF